MAAFTAFMQRATFAFGLIGSFAVVSGAHANDIAAQWPSWNAVSPGMFPDETWQRYEAAEDAGWSADGLAAATAYAQEHGSAAGFVLYDGAVLTEWGETERRFKCHSVRKSLMSALFGMAVAEGSINLDESLAEIGIDDDTPLTDMEKSAKVSDLLKARSGVYLPAAYETRSMKRGRPERGSHAPGTHWYYNNWDFNALGAIYNLKTGRDLFGDFEARLARPLGMQDFDLSHTYYHLEAQNSRFPAYPFRMSARDLARFGLLFLNEGKWSDQQIIPASWVAESTRSYSARKRGGGYGYMWWTFGRKLGEMGTYAALGYGGQAVIVVPAARLVYVNRVNTYDRHRMSTKAIADTLVQILKARTGPPKADPKLVPVPELDRSQASVTLTAAERARLTGAYRSDLINARVTDDGDGLAISDPNQGTFHLVPQGPTSFLIEGFQREAQFVENGAGEVTGLKIAKAKDGWSLVPRVGD
ncbi:serine hydrolase [Nisaea sp.]|uniref:serine hydrolase domain-containing protein n=1 Tax=Nisaea sp. TaxID=2024842 RepID=UPI003297698E